jgi:hypothetical protein
VSEGTRLIASAVLLSIWIGAGILFVAVVAPSAFAVLPSRTLAGQLVGRVLPALLLSGIVVGLAAALVARGGALSGWRLGTGLAVAAACAISQFWIGGRIARLRDSIGAGLESLPSGDPQRALFGQLHALSVAGLGAAGLAAIVGLVATIVALRQRA